MRHSSLRKRLAREAARLLYSHETNQLFRARQEAQRRLAARDADRYSLPSQEEIGEELAELAARYPLERLPDDVVNRLTMLRVMRLLAAHRPRWAVANPEEVEQTQHVVHLCGADPAAIAALCLEEGLAGEWEERTEHHPPAMALTGLQIKLVLHGVQSWEEDSALCPAGAWSISDLERQVASDLPAVDLYSTVGIPLHRRDRFQVYRSLLLPLEEVEQNPARHPEGDALYHSLQVYKIVRDALPYDEELLLAALLHDVGKGIDPADHVPAALEALAGFITERTAWLIEHHHAGLQVLDGSIGHRAHRRLRESEDYEELLLLARADRAGCCRGVQVEEVDEVLNYLQELSQENG